MRLTDAERAEIVAGMRKLQAEGKNRIHVISWNKGWDVVREGNLRKKRHFKDKGEAIVHGRDLAGQLRSELVVHTPDGGLDWRESFQEGSAPGGASGL